MKNYSRLFSIALFLISILSCSFAQIKTPKDFFGFQPGADRQLLDYEQLIGYLQQLDSLSDRLEMREIGTSTMGKKMYAAFFSATENIKNLNQLRKINEELALNPDIPDPQLQNYLQEGKVFSLATLSMHSSEVGPSQAAPIIAYELVTTHDSIITNWLKDVVYMMVPCHNPDGMDMVVEHYKKYRDTKYDGANMPGLYHKYIGHNVNRDFVNLNQAETKVIAGLYSKSWHPQVMVEKHQMMQDDVRYFVPPMHDPIAENVDEELWNWTWVFGSNMAKDMTSKGLAGVSQHYLFDDYWPGSTETANWKNIIGLLTEVASVQYAKPIFVEPSELKVFGKGLSEYEMSINMTFPWKGGWWRLSDILEYERISTLSYIKTSAIHRKDILQFRNTACKKSVAKGKTEAPFYFILPIKQHDQGELIELINLMQEHNVRAFQLSSDVVVNGTAFKKGDVVFPLSQPFRPFIKEVLEKQYFPERHYTPGGKLIKPYDITSWSLPLHKGLHAVEINTKVELPLAEVDDVEKLFPSVSKGDIGKGALFLSPKENRNYRVVFELLKEGKHVKRLLEAKGEMPAGTFIVNSEDITSDILAYLGDFTLVTEVDMADYPLEILSAPRIGIVESAFHHMDAGWLRWLFDQYHIEFTQLQPSDLQEEATYKTLDILIFPDEDKNILLEGKRKSKSGDYFPLYFPPEYVKGMTQEGLQHLMKYINEGGNVVCWGQSTKLLMGEQSIVLDKKEETKETFQFPVTDISENLQKEGLYCPGTLLQIDLMKSHPLSYGMPQSIGVFSRGDPVFKTRIPNFDMDRRVIATYPERDIVASGYAEKIELLKNKAALVWMRKGKGQVVMMDFSPHFRGSTSVSYKLIFNSLFL